MPGASRSLGEKGRKLIVNIIVFIVLIIGIQYVEATKFGQEAIDYGFDFIIKNNYKFSVINGHSPDPVSPDLSLVFFDEAAFRNSYTKGYWTPRAELGRTVLSTVRRGAKIILVDFNFASESPVVMDGGQELDDNKRYLEDLEAAAALARQNKATIVVPAIAAGSRPPKGYVELLGRYRDVFRPAHFAALRDSRSGLVRRFSWFEHNADYAPVLSANLLSYLLLRFDGSPAAQREAKAALVGAERGPGGGTLPSSLEAALRAENRSVSSRIVFRILPREAVRRNFGGGPDVLMGALWLPAQVNGPNEAEPRFDGRIVLIGSDFRENGDYHETAFGPMSGSFILANSLNTVLSDSMPEEAKILNLVVLVVIGMLACIVFAFFNGIVATIIFLSFAIFSPFLSSWVFNRYGLFFDVWIPALAVNLLNLISEKSTLIFVITGRIKNISRMITVLKK